MKTAFAILFIILTVLACGCTETAPAPAAAPAVPGLLGTWTGPVQGFDEGTGFSDYPDLTVTMTIREQHDRIFAGDFVFRTNGTGTKSGFAGVIGRDGRTLTITEQTGGYCTGTILAPDEIELTYMQDGSPYSVAIDSFKRVESHQT